MRPHRYFVEGSRLTVGILVPRKAAAHNSKSKVRERYSGQSRGGVAQSVERYVRNVEVGGSSPLTSTITTLLEPLSGFK